MDKKQEQNIAANVIQSLLYRGFDIKNVENAIFNILEKLSKATASAVAIELAIDLYKAEIKANAPHTVMPKPYRIGSKVKVRGAYPPVEDSIVAVFKHPLHMNQMEHAYLLQKKVLRWGAWWHHELELI